MFAALSSDLVHHAALFSASEPVASPLLPALAVPRLWLVLLANVCTQYPLLADRLTGATRAGPTQQAG